MDATRTFSTLRMLVAGALAAALVLLGSASVDPASATTLTSVAWSWGANTSGQLGDGTLANRDDAQSVPGMGRVVEAVGGTFHTLAVDTSGKVWGWGANPDGQLGNGTTESQRVPVGVPGLSGVISVAAGERHSLALLADGTVWAWGYNQDGRLGDGTTAARPEPVQVDGLDHIVDIATRGVQSVAVRDDGTVWEWGFSYGSPPDEDNPTAYRPSPVPNLTDVTEVAAGLHHMVALRSDGTVRAWGLNSHGQLGDGTTESRGNPAPVTGLTDVTAIAAGAEHSMALRGDGTLWTWGSNSDGQLGDGTNDDRLTPLAGGTVDVEAMAAGAHHSLALNAGGGVVAWGRNTDGQLGDGTVVNRAMPVAVAGLDNVEAISAGAHHSLAVRSSAPVAPGRPTGVTATATDGAAIVSWSAPPDGGSPITGYDVAVSPAGTTTTVAGDDTSFEITGLTNGTRYRFAVRATNTVGTSSWSAWSEPAVYATVPGAPSNVDAHTGCSVCTPAWDPTGGRAKVSWTAPADGGEPIEGYRITQQPGGVTTDVGDVRSSSISGLEYGVSYTFTVTAINGIGEGPASNASDAITPRAAPAAPSNVLATPGDGQAQVTWTSPPDGASPITSYDVSVSPGYKTVTVDGTATTATMNGLANGTAYVFTVRASNQIGHSPESALSNWVTPASSAAPPGAPMDVTARAGVEAATVRWAAPASDGTTPISGYSIEASPGDRAATAGKDARSAMVTGLTAGVTYTFTVTAMNGHGEGPPSAVSNEIRPTPRAVAGLSGTVGFDRLTAATPRPRATLAWTNLGARDAIKVQWTDGLRTRSVRLPSWSSRYRVTDLAFGRRYWFTVRAIKNGSVSAPSTVSLHGSSVYALGKARRGNDVVKGELSRAGTATPLRDKRVQLQLRTRKADGSYSRWFNAARARTTNAGAYTIRYPIPAGGSYRVIFPGVGRTLGTLSRVQAMR